MLFICFSTREEPPLLIPLEPPLRQAAGEHVRFEPRFTDMRRVQSVVSMVYTPACLTSGIVRNHYFSDVALRHRKAVCRMSDFNAGAPYSHSQS